MPKCFLHPDGRKVRQAREQKGWTQVECALYSHISKRTLERIEAGHAVTANTLIALASSFGLPPQSITRVPHDLLHTPSDSHERQLQISASRLRHGAEHLVGRDNELGRLDEAWLDPKTNILTIVAWGGVGKTALVVDWMARMARDGWRGAERVFDWSFYSQGTSETATASADALIAKALEFLGDVEMARSPASPWDKGERLARLVASRRTLLVLDGVEPLQYPPGPVGGKLRDPAMESLLKGLAQHNPGLCIVTTRESVADLAPYHDTTAPEWLLEHLSEEAGARLLFHAGVKRAGNAQIKPDDQELKDAAREVCGHALTLQLLGRYLAKAHNGDVRKRSLIMLEKANAKVEGGHAFRMMAAYERWLTDAGEEGKRLLALLRLMGLFDRPADAGCIAALRKEPAIEGLTEPLVGLRDEDWNYAVSSLRECGLITVHTEDLSPITSHLSLDAHPLVREHFGKQLRENQPKAWREAHGRLYEHLKQSTEHRPDTLERLQPLYQAVLHGCMAGVHREAFRDVFLSRITRNDAYFSVMQLGAVHSDLTAAKTFLDREWDPDSMSQIRGAERGLLLKHLGYCLRAASRLTEAAGVLRAAGEAFRREDNYAETVYAEGILCHVHTLLGELNTAENIARSSAEFVGGAAEKWIRMVALSQLAHVAMHRGRFRESDNHFATAFQLLPQPEKPLEGLGKLFLNLRDHNARGAVIGFILRYSEFSLASDEFERAQHWTETCRYILDTNRRDFRSDLHLGLCELFLGQVHFAQAEKALVSKQGVAIDPVDHHLESAADHLNEALIRFRIVSRQHEIPRAWLALSSLRRQQAVLVSHLTPREYHELLEDARRCLSEAWQIAERGSMRLFMADVLLHRARLSHDRAALAQARRLIDECGYHRRDGELADAEEAAKGW